MVQYPDISMETQKPQSSAAAKAPQDGNHVSQLLRWALPFLAALLPIVLLSVYSFSIASNTVQDLVEGTNLSGASNVSQIITEDMTHLVTLANAIASVPGTVAATEKQDISIMNIRLKAIKLTFPQIERAFVTDAYGVLWADFPPGKGIFTDYSKTEWFKGLKTHWAPAISGVYPSSLSGSGNVVAISVPIRKGTGSVIGAVVLEYSTDQISKWLGNIHLGPSGYLYVVDQHGIVVSHPHLNHQPAADGLYHDYESVSHIKAAGNNVFSTVEYTDPLSKEEMIATFQPLTVSRNQWVIVAQQPTSEAYHVLKAVELKIRLAGASLTLVTLAMVIALALTSARNQKLTRALSSKNQTLQDITSFVSHQLRAPVTAMKWTIEGMLDGDYGEVAGELKTALESLKDVAIQNGNLINDILNVSRIDRGVIEAATAPTALKEVAERALRDYRVALEKAGLSLTLAGMDLDITVQVDKEKVAEAVTNAISNAIKHTKQGGITLTLRKDDAFGYIDVTDTGEGMPPEIMNKLFDRTGTSGKNTDSASSTGLGLYIARNFMQLQKGDITVSSVEGKGSTFTYKVPLARNEEKPAS